MRWRKAKPEENYPHTGRMDALDGLSAAGTFEKQACDAIVTETSTALDGLTRTVRPDRGAFTTQTSDPARAIATAAGLTAAGARASAFVTHLAGARPELTAAAGKHLPFLVHLVCRAMTRQASSSNAGHDDYHAAGDTGCFTFFAANAQQAADFAAIARRVAERSLTPGICAQDLYETSHSVQNLNILDERFVQEYLGASDDTITSPTPAQAVAFGEDRRRVPVLLDPDRPAGVGGTQDRDSYQRAIAAGQTFFAAHIDAIIDEAFEEFGRLTGRSYGKISSYAVADAEYVVVGQGSIIDDLRNAVDYVRETDKIKVGVIGIHVARPFPGREIARLLKGKRAVTVLERTDASLSEDRPLVIQIRTAFDKALDNGAARDEAPYPGYESYRLDDKPQIFSGAYGVGAGNPSASHLVAVFRNMLPTAGRRRRFFLDTESAPDTSRFPHLETLSQQLAKSYPEQSLHSLPAADNVQMPPSGADAMHIYALSAQGALEAVDVAARTLAVDMGLYVRTLPEGGLSPALHPARITLAFAAELPSKWPTTANAALVSGEQLIGNVLSESFIENGGTVVVETNRAPAEVWAALPPRVTRWFREKNLRLLVIDARRIATEIASHSGTIDQLAVWALLGAWIERCPHASSLELGLFSDGLEVRIANMIGAEHPLVNDIPRAVQRGAAEAVEVAQTSGEEKTVGEQVDAPWTVRRVAKGDDTVFDPARFWRSVGYLYDTGQPQNTLADPHLAAGIVPGGSSAFRDLTSYRIRMPQWLAENCTGCGSCWAQCPESSLPPTIQSLSALVRAGMAAAEKNGQPMVQMNRIADHLAKQASRIVEKGGPQPYTTAKAVFDVAFGELVERMNLDDKALAAVTTEYEAVLQVMGDLPVCRTEIFFDEPNKAEKGSGTLLSIALNPMSCTACGICIEACDDDALEWVEQTADAVTSLKRTSEFHRSLPEVTEAMMDRYLTDDPGSQVNRLLDKHAYHAMVGGDGGMPGSGAKTAVHLITGAVESVMRPRFDAHVARLTTLVDRLERKIQGEFTGAVEINDFDAFARRLDGLKRSDIASGDLMEIVGPNRPKTIDGERLRYLTELLQQMKALKDRYTGETTGVPRARMILAIDAGSESALHVTYPYNPYPHPWISHVSGDATALGEGVFIGLVRRLAGEFRTCRIVELELDDAYESKTHDPFFARFDWTQFTDEEWQIVPPVIVVGGPRTMTPGSVAGLLGGRLPVKCVVIDTEGATVDGRPARAGLARLALAQRQGYVLQSSTGNPGHLIAGVIDGIERHGPALFRVYAPDPELSGIAPEDVVKQARRGYESRAWPLFTFDPERAALSLDGNPDAGAEWKREAMTVREPSGQESKIHVSLTPADWAVHEGRFQNYFQLLSTGRRNDAMKPLADYLRLDAAAREGIEPYVEVTDARNRRMIAVVRPAMVARAGEAARLWRDLQALAGTVAAPVAKVTTSKREPAPADVPVTAPPGIGVDTDVYEHVAGRLLQLCGYSGDPEFFEQSLREFVKGRDTSESNT